MNTAILVTTYNRAEALHRSLPQIAALGYPILVVDDGSCDRDLWENVAVCVQYNAVHLHIPRNRGLACALNVGISYWLADGRVEWISYFQDDVDIHPKALEILSGLRNYSPILTGHDAGEHAAHAAAAIDGTAVKYKWACRATHIHASAEFWKSVFPIPTRELGAPKRTVGVGRGLGSNADWWIVRDAPQSCQKTKRPILCVPGLVRSFLWEGKDSCWNNTQRAGEEPPLRMDP